MKRSPGGLKVLEKVNTDFGEIQLQSYYNDEGEEVYEIIMGGVFLVASYNQDTERDLGRLSLDPLVLAGKNTKLNVLIGGLGMGFTLSEILCYEEVKSVTVVEISRQIIAWNHTYIADLSNYALSDRRVNVVNTDLTEWLYETDERYDAVCLDIDNGPSWLAREENAALYTASALEKLREVVKPGGIFAVWSASQDEPFRKRMLAVFGNVDEIRKRAWGARRGSAIENFIYRAMRPKEGQF